MLAMIRHHLQRHKYKVVVGVPIVVLIASSLSFMRSSEEMCVVPEDNRFVEVGETVTLHVIANSDEPVNVIGGTISIPTDLVQLESVSKKDSIIDLWSEEPTISENKASVRFSGGIVREGGFLGSGTVLTLVAHPLVEGKATLSFTDISMLAHDGTGMEVGCGQNPITLSIRPASHPSPDVNNDKAVNIFDFGLVSTRLFMTYNTLYDLNQDGKITLADIGIVVSNMGSGSRLGSVALLWYR
ncbi:MAG: hypothetical protein KBD24_04300 [Candidatus Pacebacteria bacterium]|nr:hypothetical protein [Candidatus Paceibacterota bacterium]